MLINNISFLFFIYLYYSIYINFCHFLSLIIDFLYSLLYHNLYKKERGDFIMISSDFRKEAREKLSGKWGQAASITLVYVAILFIINFIQRHVSDSIAMAILVTIIKIPLSMGFVISLVKLFNNEEVKSFDFVALGFNNFAKSLLIALHIDLKMIVPIILIIISCFLIYFGISASALVHIVYSSSASGYALVTILGFILLLVSGIWSVTKSYYYQLAYIISAEEPDLSAKECVLKSQELMYGKRGKLCCLQFSFIGWIILALLTLGIGSLWLNPYIHFSTISFYKFAKDNSSKTNVHSINDSSDNPIQEN